MTPTTQNEWEKEFDEKFPRLSVSTKILDGFGYDLMHRTQEVKDFIRQKLIATKNEAYKEGVKDGETRTRNGVGRYQLGYADGRKEATN